MKVLIVNRQRTTKVAALLLLALLSCLNLNQLAESRSFLESIPGLGYLAKSLPVAELLPGSDLLEGGVELLKSIPGANLAISVPVSAFGTIKWVGCEASHGVGIECHRDPDAHRNVSEIIRSRKFEAEEYDVITKDGYILTIQRIVNPLLTTQQRAKAKPVILQHGLMSSSADWVINSVNVEPAPVAAAAEEEEEGGEHGNNNKVNEEGDDNLVVGGGGNGEQLFVGDSQEHPNSLGFYLANRGYDVFLANSRGNVYGQRHVKLSPWEPHFWDFTFDEQIQYDLTGIIGFVQRLTNKTKVGYVGHSQGTVMMFGLLADKPEYADIVEPFVALAPVAYVNHAISPSKYFAILTPIAEHVDMWFATSNVAVSYLGPIVCGPKVIRKDICANLLFLGTGFNLNELDDSRISAYLAHVPSGTSVKNIAHYGQEVISGRFAHYDHGILANLIRYNRTRAPDYDLSKIRSKSIALFIADNDWLASPKDVARLRASLTVEPFDVFNVSTIKPKWNHIDFVYGKSAGEVINTRILKIFDHFRG